MTLLNAFTVDVEDYYHVSAFERFISRSRWAQMESRVTANTYSVLRLLAKHDVRATFFVLGWVAQHYPELVLDIQQDGHEIGSHSYWHRLVYDQTPDEFRKDLRESRDILEQIIGQAVVAYRAPSFSITRHSQWALEILADEGFHVDSSIFPIRHDRYGIPDAEPHLHRIETGAGTLWEFPATVARIARQNIPISGGGYFRLYPLNWTLRCLRRVNERHRQPFMFYVHPWEIDQDQPRLKVGSFFTRFRHYVNVSSTEAKLAVLLRSFRFSTLSEVIAQHAGHAAPASTEPTLSSELLHAHR